jgi:hypothetical protein
VGRTIRDLVFMSPMVLLGSCLISWICCRPDAFYGWFLRVSLMCYKSFLQNYKMPQVRTASASRLVLASHSGGGFFVRRVASPGIVVAKCTIKPLARRARTRLCNKENVPPVGAVKTAPKSRSPLPDWYPRTPLRDITSIVKVGTCFLGLFVGYSLNFINVMTILCYCRVLCLCCT